MENQNFNLPLCNALRRKIGKALAKFKMIEQDDNILVGLSGGKDSLILLHALHDFAKRSPVKFSFAALSVKITGLDTETLKSYCDAKNINYFVVEQPIIEIIKSRGEKSPCSFCANMRRGIISSWASQNCFNKLALGHSLDDAVETFFMNLLHAGRAKSFQPVAFMSRTNIKVIRPLIFATEAAIIDEAKRLELPIVKSPCPFAGHTERQRTREFIADLRKKIPDLYAKVTNALENLSDQDSWQFNR
ncbi:MAG: tRNA 2-thiocytidine biosynthesis protein TtcA [Synergistaceae bacterium]|nr:tRNA 2-thiocytidine biosynthesis protein TtcA [Synergistaceae bacterium]